MGLHQAAGNSQAGGAAVPVGAPGLRAAERGLETTAASPSPGCPARVGHPQHDVLVLDVRLEMDDAARVCRIAFDSRLRRTRPSSGRLAATSGRPAATPSDSCTRLAAATGPAEATGVRHDVADRHRLQVKPQGRRVDRRRASGHREAVTAGAQPHLVPSPAGSYIWAGASGRESWECPGRWTRPASPHPVAVGSRFGQLEARPGLSSRTPFRSAARSGGAGGCPGAVDPGRSRGRFGLCSP